MGKQVVIIGAGGHAKVIADIVRKSGDTVVGFLDDNKSRTGEAFFGSVILGTSAEYMKFKEECDFIIAIGSNNIRKQLSEQMNCNWYTAIHPAAVISEGAKIGKGCCVMAGAVINADAEIGNHSIVNTGAVVEHDCVIGEYSHIAPGSVLCGTVQTGNCVWIGCGATVINNVSICDEAYVGAGATVVKNISESGTYVGTPARKIQ